jgi:hypothetical protein
MLRPIIAIAAAAFITLAFASTEASARPGGGFRGGFHGGGFHHHGGFGFRRFGPGIGLGIGLGYGLGYPYYYAGYPYGYGGCIRPRRVWTGYGWRIVPVNICRAYGYYGYY